VWDGDRRNVIVNAFPPFKPTVWDGDQLGLVGAPIPPVPSPLCGMETTNSLIPLSDRKKF
jgi:hypothetical protein